MPLPDGHVNDFYDEHLSLWRPLKQPSTQGASDNKEHPLKGHMKGSLSREEERQYQFQKA
jgi:hypothetical protein